MKRRELTLRVFVSWSRSGMRCGKTFPGCAKLCQKHGARFDPFLVRNSRWFRISGLLLASACSTRFVRSAGFCITDCQIVQIAYPDWIFSKSRCGTATLPFSNRGLVGKLIPIRLCSLSRMALISQSTNFRSGVSAPHRTTVHDEPVMKSSRIRRMTCSASSLSISRSTKLS
jgi:hypothetical protein